MFTLKLSQVVKHMPEGGPELEMQETTIIEAHRVMIRKLRPEPKPLISVQALDQQGEMIMGYYLTRDGVEAEGIGDLPYYQAIIENVSGRTTEIIRP